MRKIIAFFLFALTVILPFFSEAWFVCLGSFKVKSNAINFVAKLKEKGLDAGIDERFIGDDLYYRVLLKLDYKDIENARDKRDAILKLPNVVGLKLKDLWVCIPSQDFYEGYKKEKGIVAKKDGESVLQKNEVSTSLQFSDKPYSILVAKYKEEESAQNAKKRLEEKELDSYILKTYDEDDYFSFNVHVGHFKDKESAKEDAKKLADLGIESMRIVDYNDIKEATEKYDEVVGQEDVVSDDGKKEIPSSFSTNVVSLIKEFPIHKDFQLEELKIFDLDNIRNLNDDVSEINAIETRLINKEDTHAVSLCFYKDVLFKKNISILFATGNEGAYQLTKKENTNKEVNIEGDIKDASEVDSNEEERVFRIVGDDLMCFISNDDGLINLRGTNKKGNIFIDMQTESFSTEEFKLFLDNIANDSSLLTYPSVRKSLLVLPKKNEEVDMQFLNFELARVPPSYAESKGYAKWAIPIVGHWLSTGYFNIDGKKVSISFFDMDYNYNAKKLHDIFMDSHKEASFSDQNRSIELKHKTGWFVKSLFNDGEVSFSHKSYIIAINAYSPYISAKDLADIGDELQIWD